MLGKKLRTLRSQRGYSQQQVADAINVSRQYISKLEGDEDIMPSLDVALRIARLFGVEVDTFIEDAPLAPQPRSINTIMSELDQAIKEIRLSELQRPARVPFYGTVPSSSLHIAETNSSEYMEVPDSWVQGIGNPFIVRVRGDLLAEHGIYQGDYIIIDPDAPFTSGKIYIVRADNEFACKVLADSQDLSEMEILGRAVTAFTRKQL